MIRFSVIMTIATLLWAPALIAEDWPGWRGAGNRGISISQDVATEWSADTNIRWRLALPGPSPATPAVWGSTIFLTSADGDDLLVLAVDTSGKILWKHRVADGNRDIRQGESNHASPSPSTDGTHVWAFFGTGHLVCLDFSGKEVWKVNLQERYQSFSTYWGFSTSPLLDGDLLYVQLLHSNEQAVIAVNKLTGETVWRRERKTDASSESLHSYASPIMYEEAQRRVLITHGADYVIGHDPGTGEELWRCGGLQDADGYNSYYRFVASPVAAEGLLVVPSAKNGPVLGLRPDGASGDITAKQQYYRWRLPNSTTDVPSPLIHDGLVYICRENGVLICLDAESGDQVYQESVYRRRHRGSPVLAGGYLFLPAFDGTVSVVRAGRTFELVAQNKIDEPLSASPVIVDGTIYLRTAEALYAVSAAR